MPDRKRILLPVLVLALGLLATVVLVASRPEVERSSPQIAPPTVRTLEVRPRDVPVVVRSQGSVEPRTEATLVSEIAGRVSRVADDFESGGFVREGQPLLWIDDRDYRATLAGQRASMAQAEVALERERAEAEIAREEWQALGREGEPSPLVLRQPQLQEAEARVEAARAAVDRAELDVERAVIRAPFTGRIRSRAVDLGGFVSRGAPVATIYSVRNAEIRLPVQDRELAFLDVLEGFDEGDGPPVTLATAFAGRHRTWQGRIVRSEGEIDPETRMVHLVAQVADPYGLDSPTSAPLAVGLFVDAAIEGRVIEGAFVLPRSALRRDGDILVVDGSDRLRMRDVEVARTTRDHLIVTGGLSAGERVVVSKLDVATEGMLVTPHPVPGDEAEPFRSEGGRGDLITTEVPEEPLPRELVLEDDGAVTPEGSRP